jgi:hypothetical protein
LKLGEHCLVQPLVLDCSDVHIPVSASDTVGSLEQTLEEVPRRCIDHDFRQVLTADEIDVIDSEVYGSDLITGRPV